jgi:hypothetical protein
MQTLPRHINPFALMIDPQAVIAQIVRSGRLERLQRRICRPLDKPLLGGLADDGSGPDEVADGDVDQAADSGFLRSFERQGQSDQRSPT